jgi:hypothetical protein
LNRHDVREVWARDPFNPGFAITQSVTEHTPAHVRRIVVVVDTSATMRAYVPQIYRAIESLPGGFDVKLVWADADNSVGDVTFNGGADNAPALLQAWNFAAETAGNNAIVWIHNPQRVLLSPVDELRKRWERPYGPTLYSVQIYNGADEIEKQLDGIDEVRSVARTGLLQNDLENLFAQLSGRTKTLQLVRSSKKLDKHKMPGAQTSDHLARLWANDEVARILAPRDETLTAEARSLAIHYQLVTPVTGAVVLETAEQYRASGLQPVAAGTVPTIPEPGMVALLIVAGAFLIWLTYMKNRKQGRGACTL